MRAQREEANARCVFRCFVFLKSDHVEDCGLLLRFGIDEVHGMMLLHVVVQPAESAGEDLREFRAVASHVVDPLRRVGFERAGRVIVRRNNQIGQPFERLELVRV